jgi:hypothetical protein
MTEHVNGAALLARVKPKMRERATNICLRPDLLDAFDDANQALEQLEQEATASNARLGQGKAARKKELAQEIRDLEQQLEDTQVRFVFQAMPAHEFQSLIEKNPPRADDAMDQYAGYNRVAVSEACVRACMVSPTFEECTVKGCDHLECGSWQNLKAVCNPSEWAELRRTVDEVNGQVVTDAPKSEAASRILDKPETVSRRRASGE